MDYHKSLLKRDHNLFDTDLDLVNAELVSEIRTKKFLVIGGAGSIGQNVVKEIFSRSPALLHVVDLNENNLVELVRDIRSSFGYTPGEFKTYAIDSKSSQLDYLIHQNKGYDYILNLSALKHVRSEKDPLTLMRMVEVNILNAIHVIEFAQKENPRVKVFIVSTDKAANPVNLMGASKRIMEQFVLDASANVHVSMTRFANVAFSDGSLLDGFDKRFAKRQPIAAPSDVRRYFITGKESGELSIIAAVLGSNRDLFIPVLDPVKDTNTFSDIAINYLESKGYEPYMCQSEDEARKRVEELISVRKWPCFFFSSDTTGEKNLEEFYSNEENPQSGRFQNIAIIKMFSTINSSELREFRNNMRSMLEEKHFNKERIVSAFRKLLPSMHYEDTGKYLDDKM